MTSKEKQKGAVVGFGFISGKGHVPAYLERNDVEIVAVADICASRRGAAKKALPRARVYETYQELLAREQELDFIDISTPPAVHQEITLAALKQGLHVLCEKPIAVGVKEAQSMLLAAQAARRVLFPCHNYKHAPVIQAIRKVIESGKLGTVRSVTLQTFRNTHAKGVEEWRTDWRRERVHSGGGIAMDHGSHSFYLMFDWLGGLPESVSAQVQQLDAKWDTEDTLQCVLQFPNGVANAYLSWTAGARKMRYSVQGTEGALFVDNDHLEVVRGSETVEEISLRSDWMDASHTTWFNTMFDQFLICIAEDDFLNSEIKESYMCMEVINQCYSSGDQAGTSVPVDRSFSFL